METTKHSGGECWSASAPGRICLFGEHQDYLGLPVIAAAINLRVYIEATPSDKPGFHLSLPDIGRKLFIDPAQSIVYRHKRDYLRAAVNVLKRQGLEWRGGWNATVTSDVPINSGASSSSALQIAWSSLLLSLAGDPRAGDPIEVARIAHLSEVVEFDSPGGMMDHFASAVGGVIYLDTRPPYRVEKLNPPARDFVLVDSGFPKDTNSILGDKRRKVEELGITFDELPIEPAMAAILKPFADDPEHCAIAEATLKNRGLTQRAKKLLLSEGNDEELGRLLDEHHDQLSRNLGISLPEIDRMLDLGREAGALGGKINGSGGGGSFFLLAPGNAEEIAAMYRQRGLRAYVVSVGPGLRLTPPASATAARGEE